MSLAEKVIIGCWTAFCCFWLVSALSTKQTAWRQSRFQRLTYQFPLFIGMLLLFWRPPHSNYVNLPPLYPRTFEIADLGAVICLLGLLCALWARITLAGNWSGDVTLKQEHELVEKGPYRFVRHPIYTGMLMMSLGSSISIDTLRGFVGVVIIGLSFWYKLGQEEQLMLTHFPTQYESYKARVKAIVPFIV